MIAVLRKNPELLSTFWRESRFDFLRHLAAWRVVIVSILMKYVVKSLVSSCETRTLGDNMEKVALVGALLLQQVRKDLFILFIIQQNA